jgi:hypothetical protein
MRFSNDGSTYTPWEQFAPTRVWNLPTGDGDASIFAQFADAAGNSAAPAIAVVQVDHTAPTVSSAEALTDPTRPWQASFTWSIDDLGIEGHGLIQSEYMLVGIDSNWRSAGAERQATYANLKSGTYTIRVRVTDLAGNAATAERQLVVNVPRGFLYLPIIVR